MKKIIALIGIIPLISIASIFDGVTTVDDQAGNGPDQQTCWAIAQFDLKLNNQEMLTLCDGSNMAPTQCYRFAKSALKSKELAIKTCAKTKSMMNKIDCITDYSEYSPEEVAEICSKI